MRPIIMLSSSLEGYIRNVSKILASGNWGLGADLWIFEVKNDHSVILCVRLLQNFSEDNTGQLIILTLSLLAANFVVYC